MVVKYKTDKFVECEQKDEATKRQDEADKKLLKSGLTASEFWAHQRANRLQRT